MKMWYKWYVKNPKQLTWRKYKINLTENSLVITFSWRTKQGTFILAIKISQAILSSPKITHMEYEGIWYNRDNIIFRNFTWMKIVIESNCKSAFSTSLSAEKRSGVGTYFISWMWIYLFENAFQSHAICKPRLQQQQCGLCVVLSEYEYGHHPSVFSTEARNWGQFRFSFVCG